MSPSICCHRLPILPYSKITVAVCGLPSPEDNHAVIMCRFAHYCIVQMNRLSNQLEETLGKGTKDLQLRVGLHSGPTTAGVLRGEKARFQLFGDTVNTAARMESTSKPGLIQVSQATAHYLIAKGKQHWLQPRSDLVNAKGKGVLQTYYVTPGSSRGGGSGSIMTSLTNHSMKDIGSEDESRRGSSLIEQDDSMDAW